MYAIFINSCDTVQISEKALLVYFRFNNPVNPWQLQIANLLELPRECLFYQFKWTRLIKLRFGLITGPSNSKQFIVSSRNTNGLIIQLIRNQFISNKSASINFTFQADAPQLDWSNNSFEIRISQNTQSGNSIVNLGRVE